MVLTSILWDTFKDIKGDIIQMQGELSDKLYCLLSGVAKICTIFPDGTEQLIYICYPPFSYGEYSYLRRWVDTQGYYSASLVAVDDCEVAMMSTDEAFRHFGDRQAFIKMLCAMTLIKDQSVFFHNIAVGRSISFEKKMTNILLNIEHFVLCMNTEQKKEYSISQKDLAQIMCTARPSVTRQLQKFVSLGLVETSRGKIKILDVEGIRQFASL